MHLCQKKAVVEKFPPSSYGAPIVGKPVDECISLGEIFQSSLPAFGGAYLSRAYQILRTVIDQGIPLVVAVAGPITVSDQHRAWLIPLIRRGWVSYLTITDAIRYHDGHESLQLFSERPIKEVKLFGNDAKLHEEGVIRVTNTGFSEELLFDQDRMISAMFQRPEFQHKMTTTEQSFLMGKYYQAQEQAFGVKPGLLSTCYECGVPVFVGAPADGSCFLNSVKLQTLAGLKGKSYDFDIDLHADVLESCAYHYWGLFSSKPKSLAVLILGGGVPKNYALQPEPTLSQILRLPNIRGYDYDVQIVSSPVTDGSLSACFPAEAVSWGKVNAETYQEQTVSIQADYSMVMPFLAGALLQDPTLVARPQLRLYDQRQVAVDELLYAISQQQSVLAKTLVFPLQFPG